VNDHLAHLRPDSGDRGRVSRLLIVLVGLLFVLLPGTGNAVSSAPRDAAVREDLSPAAGSALGTGIRSGKGAVPGAATVAVDRDEMAGGDGPGPALVLADARIPASHHGPVRTVGGSDSVAAGVALGAPHGRAPPVFLS
jgi:hypothetical protein